MNCRKKCASSESCHCTCCSRGRAEKTKWSDLSQKQKNLIYALVPLDLGLKAAAWHFLYHLPKERIRGPKALWTLITTLVGTFGPLAFLLGGIKKDSAE
ncbi:DUF1289 domain-containing protein [Corynebacterium vitaeruminis]|uniref:DUF1289 domain-containing protein n=1 Tax=Corynebacterium vitaeruminis TaxID=38305 RepID=UPI0023F86A64|nr:DUF1289 domain-containing protein [Corynebacterium vitaeruminis]